MIYLVIEGANYGQTQDMIPNPKFTFSVTNCLYCQSTCSKIGSALRGLTSQIASNGVCDDSAKKCVCYFDNLNLAGCPIFFCPNIRVCPPSICSCLPPPCPC